MANAIFLDCSRRQPFIDTPPSLNRRAFLYHIRESAMRTCCTKFAVALLALFVMSHLVVADETVVFLSDSPARRAIEKRLAEPIDLDFRNATLLQVTAKLRQLTKLDIELDDRALEDAGIARDSILTIHVEGISFRSALNLLLRPSEMGWVIWNDVLLLSTVSRVEALAETAIYPVDDLLYPPENGNHRSTRRLPDFDSIIEIIVSVVAPTSWSEGAGSIRTEPRTGSIVLSQTREVHEQIVEMLASLRDARNRQFFPDRPRLARQRPSTEMARERIERTLSDPISIAFDRIPFHEAMDRLAKDHKLSILFDTRAFEEAGTAMDQTVQLHVAGIPLRQALRRLLEPLELAYVIRDEVLQITTVSQAERISFTRVYPVRELIRSRFDFDSLIHLVASELSPTTWDWVGGAGSIRAFPYAEALVISQTEDVHERVASLFAALRKVQAEQSAAKQQDKAKPEKAIDGAAAKADENGLILRVHALQNGIRLHGWSSMGGTMGMGGGEENQGTGSPSPGSGTGQFSVQEAVQGKGEASPAGSPRPAAPVVLPILQPNSSASTPGQGGIKDATSNLAEWIPLLIEPESWKQAGGKGLIFPYRSNLGTTMLIVRQTQRVHDQIEELLDQLVSPY